MYFSTRSTRISSVLAAIFFLAWLGMPAQYNLNPGSFLSEQQTSKSMLATMESMKSGSDSLGANGRPVLPPQQLQGLHYTPPQDDGSHMDNTQLQQYVDSILNLDNTKYWRVECPGQEKQGDRYRVLQNVAYKEQGIKYLFTLNLYNSVHVLPRLMSSLIQTIKYLGAENCGLSIIEGRSTDGTYNVLFELHKELDEHGVRYWLNQSDINPTERGSDRIAELSKLRNMALGPLSFDRDLFSDDVLISFVNDIVICPDDLLEMLYQHQLQNATQTCAMDWVEGGDLFYDAWVSRSMSGDTFFEIAQDMSWAFSHNMFWNEPVSADKYRRRKPLQVFSCWGGTTVLNGRPFMDGSLVFRRNVKGECYGGEPQLLASDLMKLQMHRVQIIPYVNVAYNNHEGAQAKGINGYVHKVVDVGKKVEKFEDDHDTERIEWRRPPSRYRCMPSFNQEWWVDSVFVPGDDGLQ